jgi:hypothetical protein
MMTDKRNDYLLVIARLLYGPKRSRRTIRDCFVALDRLAASRNDTAISLNIEG